MRPSNVVAYAFLAAAVTGLAAPSVALADGKAYRTSRVTVEAQSDSPVIVTPYSGRTVVQTYCGGSSEPCAQYSATYQPYAPPVIYKVR